MSLAEPAPLRPPADDLYPKMAVAGLVFLAVFEVGYLINTTPPHDALGYLIGRDFVNTWMGAKAALAGDPAPWFDFATYNAALRGVFGPSLPEHNWSYPPHLLLFTWPVGLIPYLPAYALWCAVGFGVYMLVAAGPERRPDRLLLLAVAPAVAVNIFTGQNGFFTAALMIGALTQLDRRPLLAGVLFGILTVKPQLGLLVPVMLLLTGRWRCMASAAATAGLLAAATAAIFGPDVWVDYIRTAVPMQNIVLTEGSGLFPAMMPTAFMNARVAGLPLTAAWACQAVMSAAAVAAVIWTFARRRDPVLSTALFVTASFLVTPYAFNYDMVVFGWVIALLREHDGNEVLDHRLAFAVWTLPVTGMLIGVAGIPGSCLVLAAFGARLLWRLSRERRAYPAPVSGNTRPFLAPTPER